MKGGPVERRVRGISNPGNMCFVNSVVQCMAGCLPLFRFVTGIKTPIPAKMLTLVEVSKLLGEMMEEDVELGAVAETQAKGRNTGAITGAAMASVVNEWVSDDPVRERGGKVRQEDAQEFLMHVLNALHDELARPSGGEGAADQEDSAKVEEVDGDDEADDDDDGWCQVGGKGGAKKTSVRKVLAHPPFCFMARVLPNSLHPFFTHKVVAHFCAARLFLQPNSSIDLPQC
jgi:ubiquitin carboxyl-terminal hydrolase 10